MLDTRQYDRDLTDVYYNTGTFLYLPNITQLLTEFFPMHRM
jgi:hypothetical protein